MSLMNVAHDRLKPSGLNPRTEFPAEALQQLADSIREGEVYQPLLVRPDPAGDALHGPFQIVAGERRWRAMGLLIEAGKKTAQEPMPCKITEMDDRGVIEAGLVENLQREGLSPLDEARTMAELKRAFGLSASDIATRLGLTKRHVNLRLQLLQLAKPVQAALQEGEISLAQARVIAARKPPAKRQNEIVRRIKDGDPSYTLPDNLHVQLEVGSEPMEAALFEEGAYSGATWTDPDTGQVFATDVEAFRKLQDAALEAKREALLQHWAWVEIVKKAYWSRYEYGISEDKAVAGVVIQVNPHDWTVELHKKLLRPDQVREQKREAKRAQREAAAKTPEGKARAQAPKPPSIGGLHAAKYVKTDALRSALMEQGLVPAMMAVIMGLGGATHVCRLRRDVNMDSNADREHVTPAVEAVLDKHAALWKLLGTPGATRWEQRGQHHQAGWHKATVKAWEYLGGLPEPELDELFTAVVASTVGTYIGDNAGAPGLGDPPLAVAMAETLQADPGHAESFLPFDGERKKRKPGTFRPDANFLATCGKPLLLVIARQVQAHTEEEAPGVAKMKVGDVRALIADHVAKTEGPVQLPYPFHYGTEAELLKLAAKG